VNRNGSSASRQGESLTSTAIRYLRAGLCCLPARHDAKCPAVPWQPYQSRLPTQQELTQLFRGAKRLCILCGTVSGHLEMLDFDCEGLGYDAWRNAVAEVAPGLLGQLVVERSPSGGYHVIYRCTAKVEGNLKLAQKIEYVTGPSEVTLYGRSYKPRQDTQGRWHVVVTTIETRGEGGLFLCDPSPGYKVIQGDLASPPTITPEQRELLLAVARAQNEHWPAAPERANAHRHESDLRPGEDYNLRGDVRALLQRHGWTFARPGSDGNELWRRPGKTDGWSASLRDRVFYVFTSNAPPFEPAKSYTAFAVLALLEHGGDFAAAARRLRQEGYGSDGDESAAQAEGGRSKRGGRGTSGDTIAEQLVRLALEHYRFGRTDRDEVFAVELDGPNVAIMLRGGNGDALRARLAKLYRQRTGRTCGSSSLSDALTVLSGEALDATPEMVHLRLASFGDGVVLDLGDREGRAVIVRPGTWEVVDRSPVLFRRTALTGMLPLPERGGTLAELRELLHVTDETWPLVAGWLVAALLSEIPHPILLLAGLQGSGKSCAARMLTMLVDPSPAPLRSEPRDLEQWAVAASGSWVVVLDNLSAIPQWFSDALCKSCTGDGLVKRKLYTDSDLAVLAFRRVVLLTSIDPGSLRGDLGDRLLLVELELLDDVSRRPEREIEAAFAARRPRLLGALLDALAAVLARLPHVRLDRLPRMADFARVLAACDAAGVTRGALERYLAQRGRIAAEVVEGDPFAAAVLEMMRERGTWSGTASDLLRLVMPVGPAWQTPSDWPRPNQVRGRLKRLAPALAAHGVAVTFERAGHDRRRVIRLAVAAQPDPTPQPDAPQAPDADDAPPADDLSSAYRPQDRPHLNPCATKTCVDADDADDEKRLLSKPYADSDADDVNSLLREAASDDWGVV
jgi:hypothetical protein